MRVAAIESGKTLEEILINDLPMIPADTVLIDLFDIVSTALFRLQLLMKDNKLQGIIIRGALIGALSGDNQFINNNGTFDSR